MTVDDIFAKQLGGTAKAFFESADLAITEALKGHYPGIGQIDIEALKMVFWTARDLAVSDYSEVILRMIDNYPTMYQSEAVAKATIEDLVARGMLRRNLEWVTYGIGENQIIKPSPCVYLQPTLQNDLMEAMTDLEHRSFLEYFPKSNRSEE